MPHDFRRRRSVNAGCRACWAGVLGAIGVWCTGCSPFGPSWDWTEPVSAGGGLADGGRLRADYNAFAPHALRVYPLTRLGRDDNEEPAIICHIELRDRWGDSVKALGRLQVQLYQPVRGADEGAAEQILRWDVALEDELVNAQSFDPATRTYRIVLVGLPDWVGARVDPAPDGRERQRVRLEVRAVFQTLGPNGEERVLRDGLVVGM